MRATKSLVESWEEGHLPWLSSQASIWGNLWLFQRFYHVRGGQFYSPHACEGSGQNKTNRINKWNSVCLIFFTFFFSWFYWLFVFSGNRLILKFRNIRLALGANWDEICGANIDDRDPSLKYFWEGYMKSSVRFNLLLFKSLSTHTLALKKHTVCCPPLQYRTSCGWWRQWRRWQWWG